MKTGTPMENKVYEFFKKFILADNTEGLKADALSLYVDLGRIVCSNVVRSRDGEISLSARVFEEMQQEILYTRKIAAIKMLLSVTGWSLLAAKEAVEDPNNFEQPPCSDVQ